MTQNQAEWSYKTSDIQNPKIPSTFLIVANGKFRDVVKASIHRIGTTTLWISDSTNKVISPSQILAVCLTPDIIRRQEEERKRKLLSRLPKTRRQNQMPPADVLQQTRTITKKVRKNLETRKNQFGIPK